MPEQKEGKVIFYGRCSVCGFHEENTQTFTGYIGRYSGQDPVPTETEWNRMIEQAKTELQDSHFEKSGEKCNKLLQVVVMS